MDQELGLHFIKVFGEMTSNHTDPNFPHILHLDCHTSHVTLNFLQYAKEHKIIIMGYVPHMMHLCQGLNVVLFSPHKHAFAEEHEKHEQETGQTLECAEFVVVNHWAVLHVFTPSNILAAFHKTGIQPFGPTVITKKMLAPSIPTSLQLPQVFPIVQPSPVQKVLKTIWGSQVASPAIALPQITYPPDPSPPLSPSPYHFPYAACESAAFAVEQNPVATSPMSSQTLVPSLLGALQSSSASFLITPSNTTSECSLPPLPSAPDLPQKLQSFLKSAQPPSPETWKDLLPSIQTVCELEEASVARMVLWDCYLSSNLHLQLHNQKKKREKSECKRPSEHLREEYSQVISSYRLVRGIKWQKRKSKRKSGKARGAPGYWGLYPLQFLEVCSDCQSGGTESTGPQALEWWSRGCLRGWAKLQNPCTLYGTMCTDTREVEKV